MNRGARLALRFVAILCRVTAVAMAVDVVALCLAVGPARVPALMAANALSCLVVAPLSGSFVIQTSLDGAFRGDLALASLVLFVIDWLCTRAATRPDRAKAPTRRSDDMERGAR